MKITTLKKRRAKATAVKQVERAWSDDYYTYVIPHRRGAGSLKGDQQNRSEAYDQTAIIAAMRFAGKLQKDISPVDGNLYELKPGPLVKPKFGNKVYEELAGELSNISKITASFNHSGEWDLAFWEMASDLNAGTGFMLMAEGNSEERPARYFAPSAEEMLITTGPYGEVNGIFWSRKWAISSIRGMWPDAKFGPNVSEKEKDDAEQEVVLNQDTVWIEAKQRWELTVWCEDDPKQIVRPIFTRTSIWLTPRYYKLPSWTWGSGVANLAMPAIKTVNTAQRLTLMAGAIALMGIYTVVDDGVFNPDLSPIAPGKFWKVRANGGVFGPTVKQMDPPRMDLQNIIIEELRVSIKTAMLDDTLPPQTGSVRSPTEILERVKRLADDHLGAFGRLVREIIIPKAKRDLEIAWNKKLIGTKFSIDQLLISVQISSPVAQAREAERVGNIINWIELVISVAAQAGSNPKYIAQVEQMLAEVGRKMGVPEEFIVTEDQREELKANDQAAALALAAAQSGDVGNIGQPVDDGQTDDEVAA